MTRADLALLTDAAARLAMAVACEALRVALMAFLIVDIAIRGGDEWPT